MLASDQVQFSLLYRKHEKEGLLAKAKELGVSVIAYSPLAQGMLTGPSLLLLPCWCSYSLSVVRVHRLAPASAYVLPIFSFLAISFLFVSHVCVGLWFIVFLASLFLLHLWVLCILTGWSLLLLLPCQS